jgi:hypothetical protein
LQHPDKFETNGLDIGTHPDQVDGNGVTTKTLKGDLNFVDVKGTYDPTHDPEHKGSEGEDNWQFKKAEATIKFNYAYTQWPITRPSTESEVKQFSQGKNSTPMIADPSSKTGYRTQTGWQYAPPGVPGAKPLLQHPIGYIAKFLFGGYNSVDKSK